MNQPWPKTLLFIGVLATIYLVIGFQDVLPLRPQSVHQWAQCDRASVALNFATDTYNIFQPRIHNTANGTGVTGMEFPLVNYIVGMLYRVFGFHEYLYRLVMLLIITSGLIAAYRMTNHFVKNTFFSMATVCLLFLSPTLVYYTPNFIPDAAALGLTLCGWYFYFRNKANPSTVNSSLLLLFIALAALIKISSLVSIAVMLLLEFEYWYRSPADKKARMAQLLGLLLIPVACTIAWYSYASWLSTTNNSDVFLLKHKTISSSEQFFQVVNEIKNIWLKQYYSKYMYLFLLVSFIAMLYFRKRVDFTLLRTTLWLWAGNLVYFFFMMAQFPEHDYYIIAALPVVLFQTIAFFSVIQPYLNLNKISKIAAFALTSALIIHGVLFSKRTLHDRYDRNSWMSNEPVLYNYFDITPYARSLGIRENDRVVSAFDASPQITLYLLNQKGVTVSRDASLESIVSIFSDQADYLVLNDTSALQNTQLITDKAQFLGTKNNIYFYRLKN